MIDASELIKTYINKDDWRVNEDANKEYSLQGLNYHLASSISANYWLFSLYPERVANAQINADIHIHDLGVLAVYCAGWDLKALLLKGFTGVPGKVSWAPAKHLREALNQCVTFIYCLQQEAAGAQAFSNFDTYLAPFIRYDNLSYEEVKTCLKEFLFQMSVPTRPGFQNPFSNITLDIKPSGIIANESVIIGGEMQKETYKEFTKEQIMFNKAFAEAMCEGDALGRVFTFPIPTYNITKEFDWDNPELEPMWEMTAKYGIPYFANFVNSDMKPDDVRSMCCRLRIDNRELYKRGGGLFGANPMTGSIGVVDVNLPKIAYVSKTKAEFYEKLAEQMDICKDSLLIKREVLEELTDKGLYPYARYYLKEIKEGHGKYWFNHFNTIGFVGVNEAALNLLHVDIMSDEGRKFAIEILDFMRDRLVIYQKETNQMFNLEAPPAESAGYKLALHDKKKFPYIVVANDDEVKKGGDPYYTNSTQLPVHATDDLFWALDHQDELQCKYTGGTVFHVYLGERMPSIESVKALVKKITANYKMPYFSITPSFSICPKHGYLPGEHEYCPKCDSEIGFTQ
jgi:ribonucleoside-triphosphate reductase